MSRDLTRPVLLFVVLVSAACSGIGDLLPFDPSAPIAAGAVQNRTLDPSGKTLTVGFDRDVDPQTAERTDQYVVEDRTVLSATVQDGQFVNLVLNDVVVPGEHRVDVRAGIADLEGNEAGAFDDLTVTSTDQDAPQALAISGVAVSGPANDELTLTFDDDMVAADVETAGYWMVESPIGSAVDVTGAVISYEASTRSATLRLPVEGNLTTFSEVAAVLTNMRDIAGNTIELTAFGSTAVSAPVTGDTSAPTLLAVAPGASGNTLQFTFDEEVRYAETADLVGADPQAGTRLEFADASAGGTTVTATSSTLTFGGRAALATFPTAPALGDTAWVRGVTDLAGNAVPPVQITVVARNASEPALVGTTLTMVAGEHNDIVTLTFDQPMHSLGLFEENNYGLLLGFFEDMYGATPTWNGAEELSWTLDQETNHVLQAGQNYEMAIANVISAQGVELTGVSQLAGLSPTGDSSAPSVVEARLDPNDPSAVIVVFSEALQSSLLADPAGFDVGGVLPLSAAGIGPRSTRLAFAAARSAGETLDVTRSAQTDLAGNGSGTSASVVIQTADTSGPTLSAVVGESVEGAANDRLIVTFAEPVQASTATTLGNYVATQDSVPVDLSGASIRYSSVDDSARLVLPAGVDLQTGAALQLTVSGVLDLAGNAMSAPAMIVSVVGDSTPPAGLEAFVDLRVADDGSVIRVQANEALDAGGDQPTSWSTSGSASVQDVLRIAPDVFRVTLTGSLGASDALSLTLPTDLAGNTAAGPLVVDPVE